MIPPDRASTPSAPDNVDLSLLNAPGAQGREAASANRYVEIVGSSTEVVHREVLLRRLVHQALPQ